MEEITVENAPKRARDLYNRGFTALERQNYDYAIEMFLSCVELEPRFQQARKYLRSAAIKKAKSTKKGGLGGKMKALKLAPVIMAAKTKMKSNPEAAMVAIEKALAVDPVNVDAQLALAQASENADMMEIGIMSLEVTHELAPEEAAIVQALGEMYLRQGNTRAAVACLEKYVTLKPEDAVALKRLKDVSATASITEDGWEEAAKGGDYRDLLKDSEEALQIEREAKSQKSDDDISALIAETEARVEAEPGNMNFRRKLAGLYSDGGRLDDAIATIEQAIAESGGDPQIEQMRSNMHVKQFNERIQELNDAGDEEAAEEVAVEKAQYEFDTLQDQVERYPNDLQLRFELGVKYFEYEYTDDAIKQFQRAQAHPQRKAEALYYLGQAFHKKGQFDMAKDQLEGSIELLFSMNDMKKNVLYTLGETCEAMGNFENAMTHYKAIYQVDIDFRDISDKIEHTYKLQSGQDG